MSTPPPSDRDEAIGKLSEELAMAVAVGEAIDEHQWAERFGLDVAAVRECRRALDALAISLGEEDVEGPIELPQPELPEDFELGDELGRGGMGVVYRARQRSLDREVAIKVLRPGDLIFGDALRRFRGEARSLARLRHRHIVSVYDSGETPEGLLWFTMDLVEGRTLADELRGKARMLPARAVRILRQVTSAVAHAHAQGIVHRDLKPQNVLIDGEGDAFVVDFGLSRDATAHGTHTLSGELLGTPEYMSPEQASGDAGRISEATDVWALGAMLHELLSGRGPFGGLPLHETIRAILHEEPPTLQRDKRVPQDLALVCSKAMQKRPEDRYAGALAFGEDLERFQDGRGVLAEKPSRLRRVQRVLRRRWRTIATVAAAVLVTLTAVAIWVPTIQRDAMIAQATQLTESGHPEGSIPALRSVLAETDSQARDYRMVQYQLVRALNDRIGDLLLQDDVDGAGKLASEAYQIASQPPLVTGVLSIGELSGTERWHWERARAACVHAPEEELFAADFVAKLREDITSDLPGRRAMARQVAALGRVSVADLPERVRHEVLVDSVRYAANHPEDVRIQRSMFPVLWSDSHMDAWWSPASEDLLADLALDLSETSNTRAVALRAWLQLIGLPITGEIRGLQSTSERAPTAEQIAATAEVAISRWRQAQTLPREAAVKARIDLLVEAMQQPFAVLPATEAVLLRMARSWTGSHQQGLGDAASFAAWWSSVRLQPYGHLLRERLGVPLDQPVSLREALDRSATCAPRSDHLWRQLAWLEVPDGKRFLACRPNLRGRGLVWRSSCLAAAETADDRELTLRCAVLRFDDGASQPELVAQRSSPVHIGESLRLAVDAQVHDLGTFSLRDRMWDDEWDRTAQRLADSRTGREIPRRPRPGRLAAMVEGEVKLGRDGVHFEARSNYWLYPRMPGTVLETDHASTARTWSSAATSFTGRTVVWDSGRRVTSFVLLVGLQAGLQVGSAPQEADAAWWHAACAHTFELAASAREHGDQQSAADWLTASFWPMPGAAQHIDDLLADEAKLLLEHPNDNHKMIAAMLAGGNASAKAVWPIAGGMQATAIDVRLATASASVAVRERAINRIAADAGHAWTPRLAQKLLEASSDSPIELPDRLVESLHAQPTPDGLWDTIRNGYDGFVLLMLLVLVLLSLKARRPAHSMCKPLLGLVLPLMVWLLLFVRVQVGGVVLTPTCFGLALLTAVAWASGRGTAVSWQRVVGLGVLALFVAWATASWLFGISPPQGLSLWILAAVFLAAVPWSERAANKRSMQARFTRRNQR